MSRPGRKSIILFILAFAITLVVMAPAAVLSGVVSAASSGRVVLGNTDGTVWSGQGVPALRREDGKYLPLEKMHWKLEWGHVLSGRLGLSLRWENVEQSQPMLILISMSKIELRDAVIPLYAGLLGELVPLVRPIQLSGQVLVKSQKLVMTRLGLEGVATADWVNAGSVLSSIRPLGSYHLELSGAGEKLEVSLNTASGKLLLEGRGSMTVGQGLRFQGTAKAAPDAQGSLKELLGNLGPETAAGVHAINLMK